VGQDGRRIEARLAHPVYGDALRQALPRSRQRRMLAELAGAVEAAGARRREDLLRLGRWQLEAGGLGDPGLLTRAARRAREVFDLELAARLAQAALDVGGGAEAGLVLGEARFRAGHHRDAEAVLAAAAGLCRSDRKRASGASARAHVLYDLLGHPAASWPGRRGFTWMARRSAARLVTCPPCGGAWPGSRWPRRCAGIPAGRQRPPRSETSCPWSR
jgi:hypothetical protein